MAIDEGTLTKGQLRKLTALRRSVGDELGEEVFSKWLAQQAEASAPKVDPVAAMIEEAVAWVRQRPKAQPRRFTATPCGGRWAGENRRS